MHTPFRKHHIEEMPAKGAVRLLMCGSTGSGKTALTGRLLQDSKRFFDDRLPALATESTLRGAAGERFDSDILANVTETQPEPREAADHAHRLFSTPRRSFIVTGTSDREQPVRSIAVDASNADIAILVVDACEGVQVQARWHCLICSLLGIRDVIVAVNKIDLVSYRQESFNEVVGNITEFASQLGFASVVSVPISARDGDNVTGPSTSTPWYRGPSLVDCLETVDVGNKDAERPFRFAVQGADRPNSDSDRYAGLVMSGRIRVGESIVVAKSGQITYVKEITAFDEPRIAAQASDAVSVTIGEHVDIAPGDLLASPTSRPEVSDQFAAHLIWMTEEPLIPGRSYLARFGTATTAITVTAIKYKIDIDSGAHLATHTLSLNDIGFCNFATAIPVAFDPRDQNRRTSSFTIVDRRTDRTLGTGTIAFGLRRGTNIHWQPLLIGKDARAALKSQRPAIIWLTGLSGAGKSTIANIIEQRLHAAGHHTMLLDGDNVRHGLNRDLGFTEADRVENIRRIGEVAKLMTESGLIVLCSFISPYRSERDMVRKLVPDGEFIEVYVDTPIEECIRRDPKGLYAKAKAGKIKNFTGFDAPYEAPGNPEIHLQTVGQQPESLADQVVRSLVELEILRQN